MKGQECISYIGGLKMTASKISAGDLRAAEWLQATPGEPRQTRSHFGCQFLVDAEQTRKAFHRNALPRKTFAISTAGQL